ncbi:MAG TPA: SDR family oxidoreductase [Solirubrobacterales bacterium]|jgi:2-hydroxycyclohexanecarboxyl-CoA dehydrogenase|nr:SDR family oxidoreductase [Solirubrobacterales bacterium]
MEIRSIGGKLPEQPKAARRVALITGGGGGIGREVGAELAREGLAIAIVDNDPQRAAASATHITGFGADVIWVDGDVTEQSSIMRAIGDVQQRLGPVDVLVNCAGWIGPLPLDLAGEGFWRRAVDVNLIGAIRMTHAVLAGMRERGWGRVVNIAGEAGRAETAYQSLVAAVNGGLITFTKSMAVELAKSGITVNCVSPGPTATPMLDQLISNAEDAAGMVGSLTRSVPMGRLAHPQDVAPAVAYLASEGAGYITGQTLSISGGATIV